MTPTVPDAPLPVEGAVLDPAYYPNLDELVTEDDTPANTILAEKQQRLLTEPLYSSWTGPGEGRPYLALANVGWFYALRKPPLVPDVLFSLDTAPAGDLRTKEGHSYYQWLMGGKPPDVVIEIVSDRRGGEESYKLRMYARLGVLFYVIYDPRDVLGGGVLRALALQRGKYEAINPAWFPEVGLELTLWEGTFEAQADTWLRWCDQAGRVIPTGAERADVATDKVKRLEARLRELGIDPEA
jgi:Uma2 family endonuclease